MSRNPLTLTLLAFDRDARADLLEAIGGLTVDADAAPTTLREVVDAGAQARPAIGEIDGWTVLVDTLFAVPDQAEVVHKATVGRNGYAFLWQAASASHGFGAHADGAGYRSLFRSQGAVVIDQGEPLDEESGLDWDDDPEGTLIEVASRLTGLDVADDAVWDCPLTLLRPVARRSKTARALGR